MRYARPHFHRLFRPSPPDEHDHAFRSDPAGWLLMNTTTTLFLRSDPGMYVCASRRSRPCPYVRMWSYFLSCTLAAVHTCTCYARASTTTRARLHRPVCTYTFATRMTMLHTLQLGGPNCQALACKDIAGGSQQSGGESFFSRMHFLACEHVAGGSQQSGGNVFS